MAVKAGVMCLQVELCDQHLSALEVRLSRRGTIQIYVYLYFNATTFYHGIKFCYPVISVTKMCNKSISGNIGMFTVELITNFVNLLSIVRNIN